MNSNLIEDTTGPDGLYTGSPSRTFGAAITECFNKYATFSGRASRSEFWFFHLFYVIIYLVTFWIPFVNIVVYLAFLLPTLAVSWRRLHDTGRSGWWIGGFYIVCAISATIILTTFAVSYAAMTYDPYSDIGDAAYGGLIAGGVLYLALTIGILVYSVVMIVFLSQPGNKTANKFG